MLLGGDMGMGKREHRQRLHRGQIAGGGGQRQALHGGIQIGADQRRSGGDLGRQEGAVVGVAEHQVHVGGRERGALQGLRRQFAAQPRTGLDAGVQRHPGALQRMQHHVAGSARSAGQQDPTGALARYASIRRTARHQPPAFEHVLELCLVDRRMAGHDQLPAIHRRLRAARQVLQPRPCIVGTRHRDHLHAETARIQAMFAGGRQHPVAHCLVQRSGPVRGQPQLDAQHVLHLRLDPVTQPGHHAVLGLGQRRQRLRSLQQQRLGDRFEQSDGTLVMLQRAFVGVGARCDRGEYRRGRSGRIQFRHLHDEDRQLVPVAELLVQPRPRQIAAQREDGLRLLAQGQVQRTGKHCRRGAGSWRQRLRCRRRTHRGRLGIVGFGGLGRSAVGGARQRAPPHIAQQPAAAQQAGGQDAQIHQHLHAVGRGAAAAPIEDRTAPRHTEKRGGRQQVPKNSGH